MIYIFDDGSVESKLLKHEHKDKGNDEMQVIKTEHKPDDILSYVKQVPDGAEDSPITIHLHFTRQDFLEHDINAQKNKVLAENPNIRIFFAYEFMDRDIAMERAVLAGLEEKKTVSEIVEETPEGVKVAEEEVGGKPSKTKKSK